MKFVKYVQFCGKVMMFVVAYSPSVLKAVTTQDTIGTTQRKLAKTRRKYLAIAVRTRRIRSPFERPLLFAIFLTSSFPFSQRPMPYALFSQMPLPRDAFPKRIGP